VSSRACSFCTLDCQSASKTSSPQRASTPAQSASAVIEAGSAESAGSVASSITLWMIVPRFAAVLESPPPI
jgi:hypothetical protein